MLGTETQIVRQRVKWDIWADQQRRGKQHWYMSPKSKEDTRHFKRVCKTLPHSC